jgi:hypothetical protein
MVQAAARPGVTEGTGRPGGLTMAGLTGGTGRPGGLTMAGLTGGTGGLRMAGLTGGTGRPGGQTTSADPTAPTGRVAPLDLAPGPMDHGPDAGPASPVATREPATAHEGRARTPMSSACISPTASPLISLTPRPRLSCAPYPATWRR